MQKPKSYEMKKWLCDNHISGLKIHYYPTGTDTSDTDWELIPSEGKSKRLKASTVSGLVDIRPTWSRILDVTDNVRREVDEYSTFAKKESADLATYERLKKKFGDSNV